jgi:hypothetical protein
MGGGMTDSHVARLQWLGPDQGGRTYPPIGPRYVTIVRFKGESDRDLLAQAWSLVVDFTTQPDAELSHEVRVRFFVEDAPQERLIAGAEFDLVEGLQVVAKGIVTG